MITKHYLIYSKTAVKECELLGISDLALFRYSREHTGGRVMKVFKNLILYRPRRCKKNKEDGILNNVYIITGADEIALEISKQTMKFEDMDPERIVRVRMNSKDMTISTSCIFNKENLWEAIV